MTWLGPVLAALALGGCGNLTAGGVAHGEAVVTGDGSDDASGSVREAPGATPVLEVDEPGGRLRAGDVPLRQLLESPLEGTVTVGLSVYLLGPELEPLDISGGVREVTVDIQGEMPVALGATSIPPGAYAGIRVVFTHVEAAVTSGLGGLSTPGVTTVTVDFEGEPTIAVERAIGAHVEEDGTLVATVGLGAPRWIQTVALEALRVVPVDVFRGYVRLSLE